tara:strand:+ start:1882 stop:2418 length:537 start_codon:yes stop_codon:yes gene_type:complete
MNISKVSFGSKAPEIVNVVIEVPMNSNPVKYELDKDSGALFVDRFLATPMYYPCNYGFIPNTLSDDGDPIDVLVVSELPLMPTSVIKVKPIGVLIMEDEKGMDEKILAVPSIKTNSEYENISDYTELNKSLLDKVSHFFERYKDLEKNKWVKVKGFEGAAKAKELIKEAIDRESKNSK